MPAPHLFDGLVRLQCPNGFDPFGPQNHVKCGIKHFADLHGEGAGPNVF